MKKLLLLLSLTLFIGCENLSNKTECEENNTCTVEFTNGSNEIYEIYVNNKGRGIISGKEKVKKTIPAGFNKITLIPYSSMIDTDETLIGSKTNKSEPITREVELKPCQNYYWVFP